MRFLFVVIFIPEFLIAQTLMVDFNINTNACIEEYLRIENNSTGVVDQEWDFCENDLMVNPVYTENAASLMQTVGPLDVRLKNDNGNWYAFVCDGDGNKLLRLFYGNSLTNTPTQSIVQEFSVPTGVEIIKIGNSWFGVLGTFYSSMLYLLEFGNSLSNNPIITSIDLGGFDLSGSRSIRLVQQNSSLLAFIANWNQGRIIRIEFDLALSPDPISIDFINVAGSFQLLGLDAVETVQSNNFLLASSYGTNQIYKLDFGTDWSSSPVPSVINTGAISLINPSMLDIEFEGGNYYLLAAVNSGQIYRMNFGGSLSNNSPAVESLGAFSGMTNVRGMDLIRDNGSYRAVFSSYTSNKLYRLDFKAADCPSSKELDFSIVPAEIFYSSSGIRSVTLRANGNGLSTGHLTKSVSISSSMAPFATFNSIEKCLAAPNYFNSEVSIDVTNFNWSFGDTQTSTDPNPSHQYAAKGDYLVSLQVTATNGCNNYVEKIISIYDEPIADFQVPVTIPLCTNQNYDFENTSTIDPGFPVTWQWKVNGVDQATSEDLQYSFTQTVNQSLTLSAFIPGCENEITKNILTLEEGPLVGFTRTGQCEDAPISFTNTTQGTVTAFNWDFGDGGNSSELSPQHTFISPQTYQVTLNAINAAGCNNSSSQTITVYSKPQADFSVALPPFSCSGSPTLFTDLTPNPFDSNIASWLWNFSDGGATSTMRNPQHTYAAAGDYNVSLTATTNFGCEATIDKSVTISPSPVVDFTYSPPCKDVVINFNGQSTGSVQSWMWQVESAFYFNQNPSHTFTTSGSKNVNLSVTATNGCVSNANKTMAVPVVLTPNFSFIKNCINQQTEFTDITNSTADPIVTRTWNFGGTGTGNDNPQVYTFSSTGNYNVGLQVTTQTGCVYSVLKSVPVVNAPQARFTASPEFGPAPLSVQFTNTSVNAINYLWEFSDPLNTTSTLVSPSFTYNELGDYDARLTAFNALGCSNTFNKIISAVIPFIDVQMTELELVRMSVSALKPAITIFNKGNVPVSNIPVRLDVSDGPAVQDIVSAIILPNQTYRHLVSFNLLLTPQLTFVCAELDLDDTSPDDNRLCESVEKPFIAFAPYPSPVYGKSDINVEWIATEDQQTSLLVTNMLGQAVIDTTVESIPGFNAIKIPTIDLQVGLYIVRLQYGNLVSTFRVVVGE